MLAPLAPHVAEELWRGWATTTSLAYAAFPVADPALLVDETVTCVGAGQRQGPRPARGAAGHRRGRAARAGAGDRGGAAALDGRGVRTVIVRAPKLVNIVPA